MAEWQTRQTQNLLSERTWEFKSPRPHQQNKADRAIRTAFSTSIVNSSLANGWQRGHCGDMSRAMEAARSAEHAKPPSAARTAASSRSRSPLTREPASPTPSGGPSGQARSWNGCSACRSMTSMRSCHGRFTNLTRSTSRFFASRRRVSSSRSASRHRNGRLGREAAGERDRERILEELARREFGDEA